MIETINGREMVVHEGEHVQIHRLLMVAEEGIEEVKDKAVHHRNHFSWDNRPDNLVLMDPGEHSRLHSRQKSDVRMGRKARTVEEHLELRRQYLGE